MCVKRSLNLSIVIIWIHMISISRKKKGYSSVHLTSAQNASGLDRHCKSSSDAVFKKTDSLPISSWEGIFANRFRNSISVQNLSSTAKIFFLNSLKDILLYLANTAMPTNALSRTSIYIQKISLLMLYAFLESMIQMSCLFSFVTSFFELATF